MTALPCSRTAPQGWSGKQTAGMNTKEQLTRDGRAKRTQPTGGWAANEAFLDKTAVADRLGVRPRTVGEWANQGKLPAYRIGNSLRFKWAEVEAHLAATCRVAAQSAERGVRS
jgi:excisionase family DNA binding protein